jgi:hypothetical protein
VDLRLLFQRSLVWLVSFQSSNGTEKIKLTLSAFPDLIQGAFALLQQQPAIKRLGSQKITLLRQTHYK